MQFYSIEEKWLKNKKNTDKLQIYVHNPFCSRLCTFCAYSGTLYKEKDYNFYYKEYLPNTIIKYSNIINTFVNQKYWLGGGTPNIMKEEDMMNIFSLLGFHKINNHKVIEVNPSLLTYKQIELFKIFKFNTISIGIQTFDKNVLKAYNRDFVDKDKIKNLVKYIKDLGMKVCVDILFLYGSKGFVEDLKFLEELEVDEIVLAYDYALKWNNGILKLFLNEVYRFLEITERYKLQKKVKDMERWCKQKNGIQLVLNETSHAEVLGYIYNTKIHKGKEDISTLGIGSWSNRKIYSTINDTFQYYTTMVNGEDAYEPFF
ncbi:MAG: radical SAM protein [Candidatus Omnitrophica bacterium]|nr:radical SAM protein [Candidatus Omnitrophota bacterium]